MGAVGAFAVTVSRFIRYRPWTLAHYCFFCLVDPSRPSPCLSLLVPTIRTSRSLSLPVAVTRSHPVSPRIRLPAFAP